MNEILLHAKTWINLKYIIQVKEAYHKGPHFV